MGLVLTVAGIAPAQSTDPVFEHRVVVATTSLDFERDVEESLARNVNQLAALGYEVGAILGGQGAIIDRLLVRKPYVAGQVDHGGHVFVVMHRPVGRPAPVREYRFLHARGPLGVEEIVAAYGREGFRLTVTAWEGSYFHAAFERVAGGAPVDYGVLRTARRKGWDEQMLADPELRLRLQRVVPMTLDSALVELGEPAALPAEFVWESDAPHQRSRLEARLNTRAVAGFRVQLARLRGNVLDIAMLKPAGASGPAPVLDLDDGPWGGPCGRGSIAGADAWTDGDVYCVAEDPKSAVTNRGFDLMVLPEAAGDRALFNIVPGCVLRAQMRSPRSTSVRVARAGLLEEEINRLTERGYRVTRALAVSKADGEQRLVFFTSRLPLATVAGNPAPAGAAPRLSAEVDDIGQQMLAEREREINESLAAQLRENAVTAWAEIQDVRGNRHVLLNGCARTRFDREHAETVLRGLLNRTAYSNFRIRNEVIVEP